MMNTTIRLQREPFDVAAEVRKLTAGRSDIGAVVTFTGICRADENGEPIAALTLEHYPGMAEAEIARHVDEARARWSLLGVTVIHRFGRIAPGEDIVLVVTASSHRAGGLRGGRIFDGLSENPRAVLEAGGSGRAARMWSRRRPADDEAAERWSAPPQRRDGGEVKDGECTAISAWSPAPAACGTVPP